MKLTGIIAEYNPFHNGHALHIDRARELTNCTHVIAVMSGQFVQRGEAAMFDKWSRAEMAVASGVDLVIELPFAFAVRSAQFFATGSVRLLAALGVQYLCFGAEQADLERLSAAANAFGQPDTAEVFRSGIQAGLPYAKALSNAVAAQTGLTSDFLLTPNNILAIEYLRAIRHWAPEMIPAAVAREQAAYHQPVISGPIASATAIRSALLTHKALIPEIKAALPESSLAVLHRQLSTQKGPVAVNFFGDMLLAKLRTLPLSQLEAVPEVTEGLHYKIQSCALQATSLETLLAAIKSKRYTRTRLQRIAVHTLLGTTKHALADFDAAGPLYARVLAFNSKGQEILRHLKLNAQLPLITKTTKALDSQRRNSTSLSLLQRMLALDTVASDIYSLGYPNPEFRIGGLDFLHSPSFLP